MQTPWWWRDPIVLAQLQVVFSVIGALLALGAVLYARSVADKQFKLMTDQDALMNRQLGFIEEETKTGKRIEELTREQRQILRRQGEIAEIQHGICRSSSPESLIYG
jgi:hypothetical protein